MGILLTASISIFTNAQTPGGITPQLWYKADAGVNSSSGTVNQWNNSASPGTYDLIQQGTTTLPAYNTSQINFNPSVRFDGVDDRLAAANVPQNVTVSSATPYQSSQYIIYRQVGSTLNPLYNHSNGFGGTWNVGGNSNAGMLITNRSVGTTAPVVNEIRLQSANGTSNSINVYVNGQFKSSTFSNGNATVAAGTQSFWVGGQGLNNFVNADIAEIVIYNTTKTLERPQIESYLSLKYGITKSGDYIASDGTTTFWSSTTNSAYSNNIAGIARDDNSALYQKQSMSVNSGQQLLIGLTGMANTNTANTGTLTNMQSLVVGDNGLAKAPTTFVTNIPGVNSIFGSVWKVQNTGSVGTVRIMWPQGLNNLKLVQNSSDPTFASGNTITDMSANTQTINGVVYNYADVSLADGQFFTLAAFVQAPGGVLSGLRLWLKSDLGVTTSGTAVTNWNNQSVAGLSATQATAAKQPGFVSNYMNFNPGINFANNQEMALPNGSSTIFGTTNPITSFYLGNSTSTTGSRTVLEMHTSSGDNPTFEWRGTSFGMDLDGTSFQDNGYHASKTVAANTPYIISSGFNNLNAGGQIFNMFNGAFQNIRTGNTNISAIGANIYVGGANGGEYFQGSLPEIISYNTYVNNNTDIQKINSYLAVKYGMTLDQTTPLDYLNSAGTVIWNGTTNVAYNQNIAGIERDDASALNQKQSMSVNSGPQVTIGIAGALANTNLLNTNSFTSDYNSVMWGDNGLAKAPSVTISGIAGANYRFASVWKVQNTGSVGTVRVMWPQGLNNLKLVQNSSDPTFAAGNTVTDMSANTQTINGVVYNYADVTLTNGQFFTFAAFAQAPGGVISNLRVWIKADDNPNGNTTDNVAISTWPNRSPIGGNFSGGAASPNTIALQTTGPLYRNSSAMNINFNPVAQSTSTSGLGMINAFATAGDDYTMIALNKNANLGGFRNMFSFHGGSSLNSVSGSAGWFGSYINTPIAWPSAAGTAAYTVNIPAVTTFSATGAGTIAYQVNSVSKGSGGTLAKSGTNLVIGVDADGGPDDGVDIIMPENIMYNSVLNAADYNKVVSYVAIKYGVTLGAFASPVNYTSTNSTTVWSTAASTYQNNVIGIARDDIETLHQRIAKSQDATADIITISTNNDFTSANTSAAHSDITNDQFYFMTGNNGAATTYNAQNLMLRRWKVQSTGTAQNLYIKTSDSQATNLVYADDAAMTINVVNISLTGGSTPAIQIPNGKFFTFAKFTYCTHAPNNSPSNMITKIGITTQSKQNGWPEGIPNGAVALESKSKGFVITRTQSSSIANPVEGMLIYDTVSKCMKLYNGTSWNCVVRSCNQ
ncbi:hypothetical protein CLU97_2633 [Chryseobacterium sp. 7]|uniref:beta strand repeat-containing protein n=1 Tax=Chryseobacterium sp. 7 TaxID=2035214 RepID=UPI000EB17954|nr:hypothetical protein [Chryseobacterium sp. 7]RLJ33157.1 hypothetical protein CLU97_2633 [Chryseobacterium sp. 7]